MLSNEQIESELKHLATKETIANLRAEIHKDFGDFKAEVFKIMWQTQLSTIGIVLVGVGLLIHFKV